MISYKIPEKPLDTLIEIDVSKILKDLLKFEHAYKKPEPFSEVIVDGNLSLLMTKENFSAIKGQAKGRKSTFLMLLMAGFLSKDGICLNTFKVDTKGTVYYFDTEQSNYHLHRLISLAHQIAGANRTPPELKIIRLRKYSPDERVYIIQEILSMEKNLTWFVIDGILDLVNEMNSEVEATKLNTMLMRITEEKKCHGTVVIHENYGSEKAAGHVGSYILRKAETIISINRDVDNDHASTIKPGMCRNDIFPELLFGYSKMGTIYVTEKIRSKTNDNYNPF